MNAHAVQTVQMVPVARITVVNPRLRNKKVFKEIVDNIARLGLKRPITVTKYEAPDGGFQYDRSAGRAG
jgi:ParB family chromosome partitioning protein